MTSHQCDCCSCGRCERDFRVTDCIPVIVDGIWDVTEYLCPECEELINDYWFSFNYLQEKELI